MRRILATTSWAALACGLALWSRPAEATSCLPLVETLGPADGETLPVNARPLAATSCGSDLSGWEVEIDGEPGALFVQSPGYGYGMLTTLGIDPAPAEGAVVEIRGCSEGCWDPSVERDIVRTYDVGTRDHDAPSAPELLELGFADDVVTRWDFGADEDELVAVRRWTVRFDVPDVRDPEAWEIEVGPRHSSTPAKVARIMTGDLDEIVLERESADAGTEVCAVARAIDLAGNASAVSELCVWVDEDDLLPHVPGADDDGGGDESGGGDEGGEDELDQEGDELDVEDVPLDDQGGRCSVSEQGRSGWSFAALLGLLGLRLRRDRRRSLESSLGCGSNQ